MISCNNIVATNTGGVPYSLNNNNGVGGAYVISSNINAGGIPYVVSTNTSVGTTSVDINLGYRRIQPVGYITMVVSNVVPADATADLPVNITLNGVTRPLLLPNGTPVTAAELVEVNTALLFNDRVRGLLILMSRTIA